MTLIEELKQRRGAYEPAPFESYPDELDVGVMRGIDIAIEIVKNHSDWIPASEPPKANGEYLVTMKGLNEQDRFTTINYFYEGEWETFEEKVLAWQPLQPLPKPYEGENDIN